MPKRHFTVRKTYKLFIDGAFVRSESGRTVPAFNHLRPQTPTHVPRASRKDLRQAVVAAREAGPAWAGRSAYNRGQVLYRIAEILEDRSELLVRSIREDSGQSRVEAEAELSAAIDRCVLHAGWADKYTQLLSEINPVSGDYLCWSAPEPMGAVGLLVPDADPLLGIVGRMLPCLVTGNSAICIFDAAPLTRLTLGEVLQAADVPAGLVSLLSGRREELASIICAHMGVAGVDLAGASGDERPELLGLGAANLKRLIEPTSAELDMRSLASAAPEILRSFSEIKTVWHPAGR